MKKIFFHPALFTLLLFGCDTDSYTEKVIRIERVEKVFMHQPDEFTLGYRMKDGGPIILSKSSYSSNVTIVDDVPEGQPMWAEERIATNIRACDADSVHTYLTVHVHTLDAVSGAGWNRRVGKNRTESGTIDVIE